MTDCKLDRVVGACTICCGNGRLVTIGSTRQFLCWVAVSAWVQCASRFAVTLGIGVSTLGIDSSTLGIGAFTLGRCIVCHSVWVVQPCCNWLWLLLHHFLPFIFWWIACWLFIMLQQLCYLFACFLGAVLLVTAPLQPHGILMRWVGLWCIGVWRILCHWSVPLVFLWCTPRNTGDVPLTCRG